MQINNPAINSLLRKAKVEGVDAKPVSDDMVTGLWFIPRKTGKGTWYLFQETKSKKAQFSRLRLSMASTETPGIQRIIWAPGL